MDKDTQNKFWGAWLLIAGILIVCGVTTAIYQGWVTLK